MLLRAGFLACALSFVGAPVFAFTRSEEKLIATAKRGNPKDLDYIVRKIETDPKLCGRIGIGLWAFGSAGIERIIIEVDKSNLDPNSKGILAGSLAYMGNHQSIPRLRSLLNHRDNVVREQAARGICAGAKKGDESAVIEVARRPDNMYQLQSLRAMDRNWDPIYIPVLRELLRTDPDPIIRAQAAISLATNGVREAIPDLDAAQSDREGEVQRAATLALSKLRR
jgi:hypothetical protein